MLLINKIMLAKGIVFLSFCCYGAVSIYNIAKTYNSYGAFINDSNCSEVFYVNLFNCLLGAVLSLYVVTYLVCKCLCNGIVELKLNLSLTKCIGLICFVGVNIWNGIKLSNNNECYLKYKTKNYNIAFLAISSLVFLTLIINSLFCYKSQKTDDYKRMQEG